RQPIDAHDEYIRDTPFLQIGQAGAPELGPLSLAQPPAQQLPAALEIHADGDVHRVLADPTVLAPHVHHDAIEVHDRPDRIQPPRPPGGDFGVEVGGDLRNECGRDV